MSDPILQINDLCVSLRQHGRKINVLDHVTLDVPAGGAEGLVGESGSGKSMTLRSVIGLLPKNAQVDSGEIIFDGDNLLADPRKLRSIRGTGISMIFQEPAVALNPIMRVGEQITDGLQEHFGLDSRQARNQAIELMGQVGIVDPEHRVDAYPFELSGGMRQRVMIASAIACKPKLILCDEPTTALDVTVQEQVIDLLTSLRREMGIALLYVTHDMAVVANICETVTVLYSGQVMERGSVHDVFAHPDHPYTAALLHSTPLIDGPAKRLEPIPGTAPLLSERPDGCPFAPRCSYATSACTGIVHPVRIGHSRFISCTHPLDKEA
ncbi:ABC transporter ATP-binding protein [Bifidobacterium amazonense]|uniref:ABC transporter ATP-binding protein n=1 Tax=Bifidobacterium amazonense TaxID=2809027 RepID=A0ABS9VT04_9BIFI|nr:ABC transporter ATP-binding protein [Bifidobacterium amazonense]MCH9275091.1 ABC transporter ATP-binding protein [Bifidobacterium amazonense]